MDESKVKSTLKEAREAIKGKDCKTAVKLCKLVLAFDRNNYNGLVLFGAALQDSGQKDHAEKAFLKAIGVAPKQILAYQGLASLYEKREIKAINEDKQLIEVYHKILSMESDVGKFMETCKKLATLAGTPQNTSLCLNVLRELTSATEDLARIARKTLIALLLQIKPLPSEYDAMLEDVLAEATEDRGNPVEVSLEYSKAYLKILYKHKKNKVLCNRAKGVHTLFPNEEFPLEWMCKVYSEEALEHGGESYFSEDKVIVLCDKLLVLNPDSTMAKLAKGAQLFKMSAFYESKELLQQVGDSLATLSLISQCYLQMHCFDDAEAYAVRALKIALNQEPLNEHIVKQLQVVLTEALSMQNTKVALENAVSKSQELLQVHQGNADFQKTLVRASIKLGINELLVEEIINRLEQDNQHRLTAKLFRALILRKKFKWGEAADMLNAGLNEDPNSALLWLELGQIHREDDRHDLSLQAFLKAAKLAPYCSTCFIGLGEAYSHEGRDLEKARRCFLKAYQLNSLSEKAGVGLGDTYRLLKNEEGYSQLLKSATSESRCGGAKWAWVRLGLLELEQNNFEQAINCLRAAIRADPNDSHCWECLGDAYAARGSYTSALRSYHRVGELEPKALYPMFQIANIRQMLGLYEESAEQFKLILETNHSYVPALKGLGETYLSLARATFARQLVGCARDFCQQAFHALSSAAKEQMQFSCLWKLLGDVCSLVAHLPEKYSALYVPAWLACTSDDGHQVLLTVDNLLELGTRCYCRALALLPDSSFIWQDLAVNFHLQANISSTPELKIKFREWALAAAKNSISINVKNWQHWNLLGIIASSPELKKYQLAQHAFIKAIQVDSNNAVAWTNLATLYLSLDSIKLANMAYRMAQKTDPSYMQSWIGQASIAEITNHEDAMDLFRHTTELGTHPESCIGYAHWVCSILQSSETKKHEPDYIYSIENMYAVPRALDAITWFIGVNTKNSCAYNMQGLLMERQGLHINAMKAFEMTLRLLELDPKTDSLKDLVRCNYARVLVQRQRYNEAIQQYQLVKEANFTTQCGLALAYFKAEKYAESYSAYETALHWLAPDDGLKSHVLVAMAAMAYMFQGVDDAKTLLYKCITLKPPSVQGLFAACSLGLLHSDLKLAELVLNELAAHKDNPKYITDIAIFKAYTFFIKEHNAEAVRALASCVHRHPGEASLWLALALFQLQDGVRCDPVAAGRCAHAAMLLGRGSMDVSKVMSLVSLSDLLSGKAASSLISAQKAVHMFPDIPENWLVLIASYLPQCIAKQSELKSIWLKRTIDHVRRRLDTSRKAGKWLSSYERKVTQLAEEYQTKEHNDADCNSN